MRIKTMSSRAAGQPYRVVATSMLALGLSLAAGAAQASMLFEETNLISDGSVPANNPPDGDLINPWGISYSPTGPFWVSDNVTGLTTFYNGAGAKQSLFGGALPRVTIATPPGQTSLASPTGQVFNVTGGSFNVTSGGVSGSSAFIFATEDGTISGWVPSVSHTSSFLAVDNSKGGAGAVYKGLAITQDGHGQARLYAANFRAGTVEVYDNSFGLVGTITDPTVPAGYAMRRSTFVC
jgi:uncharacterized protein (TIGR03118 family)